MINAVAIANVTVTPRTGVSHVEESGIHASYSIDRRGDFHMTARRETKMDMMRLGRSRNYHKMLKAIGW